RVGKRSACTATPRTVLEILRRLGCGDGLGAHGQERAEEQNGRAPDLGMSETFAVNPRRKSHCAGRAEKLERLGKGHADLSDGHIVKDMRERDAAHGGDDQDQINLRPCMEWGAYFSKCNCERKQ